VILVDSSVWIDHLRNTVTRQVSQLRSLISSEELVGDLILCEVLQGLSTNEEAALVEEGIVRI
jgi:predicted nucleic acid-binding protein